MWEVWLLFDDVEGAVTSQSERSGVQGCTVWLWLFSVHSSHCQMIPQFSPDGSADGWSFALNLPSQGLWKTTTAYPQSVLWSTLRLRKRRKWAGNIILLGCQLSYMLNRHQKQGLWMLSKSSIASKHDLVVPLMANSDRPLLMSCIQHLKSLQQNISTEHVLFVHYNGRQWWSNKDRNLIVYPFQRNDDEDEYDGQTESFTVKPVNHLPWIKLLRVRLLYFMYNIRITIQPSQAQSY